MCHFVSRLLFVSVFDAAGHLIEVSLARPAIFVFPCGKKKHWIREAASLGRMLAVVHDLSGSKGNYTFVARAQHGDGKRSSSPPYSMVEGARFGNLVVARVGTVADARPNLTGGYREENGDDLS